MAWLYSLAYGVIQGITEWLPISSTGHLILFEKFFYLQLSEQLLETFRVAVHLGSVFAVLSLYFKRLYPFSRGVSEERKKEALSLWKRIIVAVIPAGTVGLLLDEWFTDNFYNYHSVSLTLIIYGVLFIFLEKINEKRRERVSDTNSLPISTAILIGVFQTLAIIPGTSRSGATILGAMLLGCSRTVAAEFSFFLSMPVILGAALLKLCKHGLSFSLSELMILLTGALVSFVFAKLSVSFLLSYVKRKSFAFFGYYRIALGLLVLLVFGFC